MAALLPDLKFALRMLSKHRAFGARPFDIGRLGIRHGAVPIAAGLPCGAIAAFGAARTIESQLFGVTAVDPIAAGFVLTSSRWLERSPARFPHVGRSGSTRRSRYASKGELVG
jgi:hypothetical protein